MRKIYLTVFFLAVIVLAGFGIYKFGFAGKSKPSSGSREILNAKNGSYSVEKKTVKLTDGYYEEAVPGSEAKEIIRYFGNAVEADMNGDGAQDSAFLLTRESGGSGTFFYLAALVSAGKTFAGTNAVLLGDRIAPQTTEYREGRIIVNYAERKPGEPFSASPSAGVSRYFKIDNNILTELGPGLTEFEARKIAERICIKGGEALGPGTYNEAAKTWWFDANLNAVREGCAPGCVVSEITKNAEVNWRCTGLKEPADDGISDFKECEAAGNPVMESYPRQCRANGLIFVEEIKERQYCTKEQRNSDFCAQIYVPVCAKVNIQCIKAPCDPIDQTFSNACEACKNSLVESYVPGECLK